HCEYRSEEKDCQSILHDLLRDFLSYFPFQAGLVILYSLAENEDVNVANNEAAASFFNTTGYFLFG
ncbi:hypothetical protein, partial [Pantoea sp. 3_1284]|uniref:hypothetical protein n=1 Tax=Pantoea sp. 3_1284 TaxID=2259618 RepID=UPI001F251C50